MTIDDVDADLLLVGAGPAGLYGAYYAGFRGLRVAVIDAQPQLGGQITAIYPEKAIYDIAGLPAIQGQQLVDDLARQAAPFDPVYLLGEQAVEIEQVGDRWTVRTSAGRAVRTGAIVITSGVGTVVPRPLPCAVDGYLGHGLRYFVPRLDVLDGKDVVVIGGGDSALDWALAALPRARSVALVHRRQQFRAHEHSVRLLQASACRLVLDATVTGLRGNGVVDGVEVQIKGEAEPLLLPAQEVVAALGFLMNLGPLAHWGLELEGRSIRVDSSMRTNLPDVYAAGDVTTYPGKVKLISVGFGEVATAVNNAAVALDPNASLAPGHSSDSAPAFALPPRQVPSRPFTGSVATAD